MPSEQVDLTPERLIGLATEILRGFATTTILSQEESNAINICTKCIALDTASFGRNTNKKRAHAILTNIWQQSPALFVVVALSSTVTQLGTMKSKDYLRVLLAWWNSLNRPNGFQDQEVLRRHFSILPPISLTQPMTSTLQREDFILFLQTNPRAIGPFKIFIPEGGRPYVELSSEICQDLILVAMDRTQRREC